MDCAIQNSHFTLVNETAIGPTINPMKALYWKQFGGGPTEADMKRMNPTSTIVPK